MIAIDEHHMAAAADHQHRNVGAVGSRVVPVALVI